MEKSARSLVRGIFLSESQLDDAVHQVQLQALSLGMIPIAAILSRRVGKEHEILGFGFNHLREGIPGIHGETGAVMNMGRRPGGYGDVVATSSLNPCPFCQRTLACHMGVREVRILDTVNYSPDLASYRAVGMKPVPLLHRPTAKTFATWVNDPANAAIWARDIGIWNMPHPRPFDVVVHPERTGALMAMAHEKAAEAPRSEEAPIGAVVVDAWGEVIGAGHARVVSSNDPSCVAAMAAWRACGGREHWKDKTLFLTAGPDHIAYSMFHIFNFGQLVIASDRAFAGQLSAVRKLGVPVHLLNDRRSDRALAAWIRRKPHEHVCEYLGADFHSR